MKTRLVTLGAVLALGWVGPISAQALPEPGYLCCNLRTDGNWASDGNFRNNGNRVLEPGTRLTPLRYSSSSVEVEIDGTKQYIGNDYSREMPMDQFARRWIVSRDPKKRMATWSPKVREAVKTSRVRLGMNREQVLTSLGYPRWSDTPYTDATTWLYRLDGSSEFRVAFGPDGLVKSVRGEQKTLSFVLMP